VATLPETHFKQIADIGFAGIEYYPLSENATSESACERIQRSEIRSFGAPLLHIKDGRDVEGKRMYEHVPVGESSLDFHAIARTGGGNIEWMVVEFAEYDKDVFDGVAKSYTFLKNEGLAQGRV
jgi:sugar phosphate isomerase/epimerase